MQADWERRAAAAEAQARPPAPKPEPIPPRPAATNCRPWTDDEKDILWQYGLREAFDLLEDRTLWSIRQQRYRMGVVKAQWSPEEDVILRTHGNTDAVRLLPHRTMHAISARRVTIGAPAGIERPWTRQEDAILRTRSQDAAHTELDRSMREIRERCKHLEIPIKVIPWTTEDDQIALTLPIAEAISRMPGRTKSAIKNRRIRLSRNMDLASIATPFADPNNGPEKSRMGAQMKTVPAGNRDLTTTSKESQL